MFKRIVLTTALAVVARCRYCRGGCARKVDAAGRPPGRRS